MALPLTKAASIVSVNPSPPPRWGRPRFQSARPALANCRGSLGGGMGVLELIVGNENTHGLFLASPGSSGFSVASGREKWLGLAGSLVSKFNGF